MAQEDLIPFYKRTKDEQREICRKGGIASGESRRRKKTLRELAEAFGNTQKVELQDAKGNTSEVTANAAVVRQLYHAAIYEKDSAKRTKAAQTIMKLLGEDVQQVRVESPMPTVVTPEEYAALLKVAGIEE